MILSKCAVCDSKRSKFAEEQETSGLLLISLVKRHLWVKFL